VQSPQPTNNPNHTQNQKQAFLQLALEEEVVGGMFSSSTNLKIKT
jgi:hypothetical protein